MKLGVGFQEFLSISGGAIIGANARHWLTRLLTDRWGSAFPYATLAVNFSGSLMLGLILGLITHRFNVTPHVKLALTTGFLGAYTTFSTFAYESINLIVNGHWGAGLLNLGVSVLVGALGAAFGLWIGGLL